MARGGRGGREGRGGHRLARVAVVVRAGAAPLGWLGVFAAGTGAVPSGLTGRTPGIGAGVVLFVGAAAVVALTRRKRYVALARGAARAGRHDVLQDRRVSVRDWRRGHRWWLLLAFAAALGSAFAVPVAGGLLLAGAGLGLRLKAAWIGRRERALDALLWVRVDWLDDRGGDPAGKTVKGLRATGVAAGDAAPGGARRRTPAAV
ncbi:hypothetical protein [Streptomyces sp. NPDC059575]|uniref:hypothetical protein n=1 Tax=Streptomyces sp. NPDC059575 TaxID=3346872 RepID=UPI0036BD347C